MDFIAFKDRLVALQPQTLVSLFRECTPRVLVVTDTLNYNAGDGFGLTQFVNTLKASTIHGMTPIVRTASRTGDPNADLPNFDFNHPTNGLVISRWDVVFLFGARTEGNNPLPPAQVATIAKFMDDGGGVFATGDHETLGASLCADIPRVRSMRKWRNASAPPHVSNTQRFSTNLSGSDETEEFADQSDRHPQRLYLNFRTRAGGVGNPHPLMQARRPRRAIEVFPDHPHEGECLVPSVAGPATTEWPKSAIGADVPPEAVAMSVSHGDGFPSGPTGAKQALVPRLFVAISAYDGHRARVGRVVTDSTWHHFININLDGTGEPGLSGLTSGGADTDALVRVRQHYVNLATWLMPAKVRRCLRFPLVLRELARYPLFEELELRPLPQTDGARLRAVGELVARSLARHATPFEARELADDALEDALGAEQAAKLLEQEAALRGFSAQDLAHAALGGLVTAMAGELASLQSLDDIRPHKTFEPAAAAGARAGAKLLFAQRREELRLLDEVLSTFERPLNVG